MRAIKYCITTPLMLITDIKKEEIMEHGDDDMIISLII
jgi:hypothetical protein